MVATLESLKKAFLIGLGATVMTAEKIKELIDELVERGELSQKEAETLGKDLRERAIKETEQFEARVKETVETCTKKAIESLGLVTREDFEALKKEMAAQKAKAAKG